GGRPDTYRQQHQSDSPQNFHNRAPADYDMSIRTESGKRTTSAAERRARVEGVPDDTGCSMPSHRHASWTRAKKKQKMKQYRTASFPHSQSPQAARGMPSEVRIGHLAAQHQCGASREQSRKNQDAANRFQNPGNSQKRNSHFEFWI